MKGKLVQKCKNNDYLFRMCTLDQTKMIELFFSYRWVLINKEKNRNESMIVTAPNVGEKRAL